MERKQNEGNSTHHQQPAPPVAARHHHPPPPHLKCPRCDSSNTKFCYYNNYSLSQPRYFCKACRRYWTHGGTLRNVPVGGGCRKNKRPSKASSSSVTRSQNPTAVISGQPSRPLPHVIPQMSNSFYGGGGGGTFLPSFAAVQSLPAGGGSQGMLPPVNLNGGGGQFGANMSLLQAMSLQSLKSQAAANQFQPPTNLFPAQQNLVNPPIGPWAQNLNTAGGLSSSAVGSGYWNGATGSDQAGTSFSAPNRWSTENLPGFNPSHQ